MKTILNSAAALGLALAALSAPSAIAQTRPAAPAAPTGTMVPGVGIANVDAIVANSNAYRTAATQRQTSYKPVYDQAQARAAAIDAELKPLIDRFNADRAAKKPEAQLQTQYAAIQQRQQAAQEEIQRLLMPVSMSEAYVVEQIEDKLNQAIRNAMTKAKVTLLLSPQAVIATENAYNLTPSILNELNTLIPAAQLVPPQGWEPRQVREARAAQAQPGGTAPAAGAAPAAGTPAVVPPRPVAGPQPEGR